MLIESLKNKSLAKVYEEICFNESVKNPKLAKMLTDWKKKYLSTASNENKVKNNIDIIAKLLGSDEDNNIDLMDKITSYMIIVSKYVNDEASDALANILKEL